VQQSLCQCLVPDNTFEDLQPPVEGDYLWNRTMGQTFRKYIAFCSELMRQRPAKSTVYIQMVYDASAVGPPSSSQTELFAQGLGSFFCLPVQTHPLVPLHSYGAGVSSKSEVFLQVVCEGIRAKGLPTDAFCSLAVVVTGRPATTVGGTFTLGTTTDHVGAVELPFAAGQAQAIGFLQQMFLGGNKPKHGPALASTLQQLRTMVGRFLGIQPCTYFNCCMRGTGDRESQPLVLYLCPLCLRKLHWNIGFDICNRYAQLIEYYESHRSTVPLFEGVLAWTQGRLSLLHGVGPTALSEQSVDTVEASPRVSFLREPIVHRPISPDPSDESGRSSGMEGVEEGETLSPSFHESEVSITTNLIQCSSGTSAPHGTASPAREKKSVCWNDKDVIGLSADDQSFVSGGGSHSFSSRSMDMLRHQSPATAALLTPKSTARSHSPGTSIRGSEVRIDGSAPSIVNSIVFVDCENIDVCVDELPQRTPSRDVSPVENLTSKPPSLWVPRNETQRLDAIGLRPLGSSSYDLESMHFYSQNVQQDSAVVRSLTHCLTPHADHFEELLPPVAGCWLWETNSDDQCFETYVRSAPPHPSTAQFCIYLQLLHDPRTQVSDAGAQLTGLPSFTHTLAEGLEAFFSLPVRILPPQPISGPSQGKRHTAMHALQMLQAAPLPADAFCFVGCTPVELSPTQVVLTTDRVAVFSLARMRHQEQGEDLGNRLLLKSCLLQVRRLIGRLIGLAPCTFYNCAMRATNQEEYQRLAVHVCPVCLRKLHWNIGFDILHRYKRLIDFYSQQSGIFEEELMWTQNRRNMLIALGVGPTSLKASSFVLLSPSSSSAGQSSEQDTNTWSQERSLTLSPKRTDPLEDLRSPLGSPLRDSHHPWTSGQLPSWSPPDFSTQLQAIGLDLLNEGNAYFLRLAKPYYPIPTQRDLVLQASMCKCLIPDKRSFENITTFSKDWGQSVVGQPFEDFVKSCPWQPESSRPTIYILPLCEPDGVEDKQALHFWYALVDAMSAFFVMQVRLFRPQMITSLSGVGSLPPTTAQATTAQAQPEYSIQCIMTALLKWEIPKDAYCVMAVTLQKLVPGKFLVSMRRRIGVASLVREELLGAIKLVGRGFCKLIGMEWCVYFNCLMRWAEEKDTHTTAPDLCPVCLRKLHWTIGFDIMERYRQLQRYYGASAEHAKQFEVCKRWVVARMQLLIERRVGPTSIAHLVVP